MNVSGRVLQAFLKSYDFWGDSGPLELDGIIGPNTEAALYTFDGWVASSEEHERLWGDYSIIPAADRRSVEIVPDAVARRIKSRGEAYLAEHTDEIVFPREPSRAPAPASSSSPTTPAVEISLPFWRLYNPWAWLLAAAGFFGLSGLTFYFVRRKGTFFFLPRTR